LINLTKSFQLTSLRSAAEFVVKISDISKKFKGRRSDQTLEQALELWGIDEPKDDIKGLQLVNF